MISLLHRKSLRRILRHEDPVAICRVGTPSPHLMLLICEISPSGGVGSRTLGWLQQQHVRPDKAVVYWGDLVAKHPKGGLAHDDGITLHAKHC